MNHHMISATRGCANADPGYPTVLPYHIDHIAIVLYGFPASVQLKWLPNEEPDLAGYKVHYAQPAGIIRR